MLREKDKLEINSNANFSFFFFFFLFSVARNHAQRFTVYDVAD
jgi:hypothetical protein